MPSAVGVTINIPDIAPPTTVGNTPAGGGGGGGPTNGLLLESGTFYILAEDGNYLVQE